MTAKSDRSLKDQLRETTSRWKMWWRSGWREDCYLTEDLKERSIFLGIAGWAFAFLRHLNVFENIKRIVPDWNPDDRTPARVVDGYILVGWAILILATSFLHEVRESLVLRLLAGWWTIQLLQTSLYHDIWRTLVRRPSQAMGRTHNHVRNAIIGILNFLMLCWLFGVIYWWSGSEAFYEKFTSIWNAIYFGFVTGATVGYGEVHPASGQFWPQFLVVLQIIMSLSMVAVILARAVSSIEYLKTFREGNCSATTVLPDAKRSIPETSRSTSVPNPSDDAQKA